MKTHLLAAAAAFAASTASAATFDAVESYYTFGTSVSANQERLLADKANVIGFAGLETISFVLFDIATFVAPPTPYTATLKMEQDTDLAGTLIPVQPDRTLSVGVYALDGAWDPVGGNLADARYGTDGDAAFDTVEIGPDGVYSWDVTDLFTEWVASPGTTTAIVVTGLFGNVNTDDRNTYASFHASNSTTGTGPHLVIAPIPLPAALPLALAGLSVLGLLRARRTS